MQHNPCDCLDARAVKRIMVVGREIIMVHYGGGKWDYHPKPINNVLSEIG
jgi:hypothetical protein